jgi:hypothetical protein
VPVRASAPVEGGTAIYDSCGRQLFLNSLFSFFRQLGTWQGATFSPICSCHSCILAPKLALRTVQTFSLMHKLRQGLCSKTLNKVIYTQKLQIMQFDEQNTIVS